MAEETEENNKKICQREQNVRCPENGWIVCRSKKRPGLYYDFNTSTGEALWRDAECQVEPQAAMLDHSGKYDCHEPTEPPSDSACCKHHNVTQSSIVPKIYNKQVINNQFPTKQFPIAPFGNAPSAQYGLLNSNNNMAMNSAPLWLFPQTPFYGTTIPTINPQSVYESLQNIQLSNRFQILNRLNNENPLGGQLGITKTCHNIPRKTPNFVKRHTNTPKDLRSLLSDRRRQDLQNNYEVPGCPENTSGSSNDLPRNVTEDEINPDDMDEWLETHTDSEGKKLNFGLECIWELASSSTSRDCWYMVTSSKVLLNNIRFFSTLAVSDDRLRLLAPQDVVRGLRSATFSDKGRFAECAKRLLLTIRQNKVPNALNDASIVKTCSELIGQNKHVVLLIDEKDLQDNNTDSISKFSVKELKQFLTRNLNRNYEPNSISKIQKICEKLKIIVPNTEAKPENESRVITTPTSTSPQISTESRVETETEATATSGKRTANACVQTDFAFPVTQLAERTLDHEIEMKISPPVAIPVSDTGTNDTTASKAAPRKIKLKRQFQSSNIASESDERKTFKWRKRRDICSTPNLTPSLRNTNSRLSCSHASSLSNSTNDLTAHQNDNAMDGRFSDVSLGLKLIEETSTSGVVSNSIDSDTMFKINKQTILNESQANQNEEIVMYEVTSDFMNDRLRTRCDEWALRFSQVMEAVLSDVLLMEPAFKNETMSGPWNIQEALPCIKRKFVGHGSIVGAANKLAAFLFKINDNKGNIKQDISSKEFMEMFSYGVNLIKVLELELPSCEDLKIASKSLFELLSDIREPNLVETDESFNDNTIDNSANVSGTMTSLSTDVADCTVPGDKGTPRKNDKGISCNNSPARYSLRSSRINIQKKRDEEKSEAACSSNKYEYSLFSSLGLKKNTFNVDMCITKTITNVPQEQQRQTLTADPVVDPDIIKDVKESNELKSGEPKIIRSFTICPEIEMRLKGPRNIHPGLVHQEHAQNGHVAVNEENTDFTEDAHIEDDQFIDENNHNLIQMPMDAELYCESSKSGDLDSNGIFKWVVRRITSDYNKCLVTLRQFCENTHEELKAGLVWDPEYKTYVMEKTKHASALAVNICKRLECLLNREPSVTRSKFQKVFNVCGVYEDMSDSQLDEYTEIIEKYIEHADRLLCFVTFLVNLVKEK